MASFVKDEKRRHDDVSRLLGWIRIPPFVQAEVDNSVGLRRAHVQLKEETERDPGSTRCINKTQ